MKCPRLVLAPMDGVTDAPMRALQGELGAFRMAVTEFLRVNQVPISLRVFRKYVPELANGCLTSTGLPVQVQILGGHPERMAQSALNALQAGANSIDINFGCPAPTVNRNDGGATILKEPCRVKEIVRAVRQAVPRDIPVSAKIRLGWERVDEVHNIAGMVAEGGASWLTIHARTKMQKYQPPVNWRLVGEVRRQLDIPVVVNGDIWSLDDFRRCREQSGCEHFMLGRGALARPRLPAQIASDMGLEVRRYDPGYDWISLLQRLSHYGHQQPDKLAVRTVFRMKQWLNMARKFGDFAHFELVKKCQEEEELLTALGSACGTAVSGVS